MGGFSAFASGGDWKMLCICLVLGNILGVCCDYSGRFLAENLVKIINQEIRVKQIFKGA